MTAVDELLERNDRYAVNFTKATLPASPAKKVVVLACMDARLDPARALGLEEGDSHVIRNAGGVATDDVVRSIIVSQRLLGTEEVMVVHHTDCGMMKFSDDDLKQQLAVETGIRPPFALEAFPDLDGDVRQTIARLRASPFVLHKDRIRGFVYDVESGKLREVV